MKSQFNSFKTFARRFKGRALQKLSFFIALFFITGCHGDMQFLVGEDPQDHAEYLRKRFGIDGAHFLEITESYSREKNIDSKKVFKLNGFRFYEKAWFSFISPIDVSKRYQPYLEVEPGIGKNRIKIIKIEEGFEWNGL